MAGVELGDDVGEDFMTAECNSAVSTSLCGSVNGGQGFFPY